MRAYIAEQEAHLREVSFQKELRRLLERYQFSQDEQYLWDCCNRFTVAGTFLPLSPR